MWLTPQQPTRRIRGWQISAGSRNQTVCGGRNCFLLRANVIFIMVPIQAGIGETARSQPSSLIFFLMIWRQRDAQHGFRLSRERNNPPLSLLQYSVVILLSITLLLDLLGWKNHRSMSRENTGSVCGACVFQTPDRIPTSFDARRAAAVATANSYSGVTMAKTESFRPG